MLGSSGHSGIFQNNFTSLRCLIIWVKACLFDFFWLFAVASVTLMANEQKQVPNCCEPESEKLSQSKVKALVKHTEPIHAPCCADMLHCGTIALCDFCRP